MKITLKKDNRHWRLWCYCIIVSLLIPSCKKQDNWLDVKSVKSSVRPTTLKDYQAILDNAQVMNLSCPVLGELGADNLYLTDNSVSSSSVSNRNAYLWQKDVFEGATSTDWNYPYQEIEYANIVLDGLQTIQTDNSNSLSYNNIKGSALFFRAFSFYNLAQLFCKPYIASTASIDLGIPLRLTSDVNVKTGRGTVQQSYDQIIQDLQTATSLLPQTPVYKTRPSTAAAYALLSKVYLSLGDYQMAFKYADLVLNSTNTLIDFNTLNAGSSKPFPSFAPGNAEVIFYACSYGNSAVWPISSTGRVNPDLYNQYDNSDLRKTVFYSLDKTTGLYIFKASYESSNFYNFTGIATNEMYLVRAEAAIRLGKTANGIADINTLLKKRYVSGSYLSLTSTDPFVLLSRVNLERRKELPFTGNLRWEDLRRFNQDPQFAVSPTRTYQGKLYTLTPNSNLYVLPIPDNEIQLNGIPQNQR